MTEPASSLQLLFVQMLIMIYYFITTHRIERMEDKIDKILEEKSKLPKEEEHATD